MWFNKNEKSSPILIQCLVFAIIFGCIKSTYCAIISGFFTDIDFIADWKTNGSENWELHVKFHHNGEIFPSYIEKKVLRMDGLNLKANHFAGSFH